MKRPYILFICCSFLVLAILAAASQFLLKPAVEREFADRINEYFTAQGLVPETPVQTTVKPISRTLTIHPFAIRSNPDLKIKKGTFEEAELSLTWQGLFAFSPLSFLVPKSGEISLLNQGTAKGVYLNVDDSEISIGNSSTSEVKLDANDLEALKSGDADILRDALTVERITLDSMTISIPAGKQLISLGPIVVTGTRKNMIEQCVIENIAISENKTQLFSLKKLNQKNISLLTEKEWVDFANEMSGPSEKVIESLFDLLMGEKPLVEGTVLNDITFMLDKTPLAIESLTFNTAKNAENTVFTISRMKLPSRAIEEEVGQRLPLPPMLHLTFSLAANRDDVKNYLLSGKIDVEELLSVDLSLTAGITSLKNFEKEFEKSPLKNFRLLLTDKSLLARTSLYLAPDGSGKNFVKKQIPPTGNPKLDEKIQNFIEYPGIIEIASSPEKSFTLPQLEAMSDQDAIKNFTFTVTPGPKGLDEQITDLQNEK